MKHLKKFEKFNSNKVNEELSPEIFTPAMSTMEFILGAAGGLGALLAAAKLAFGGNDEKIKKVSEIEKQNPDAAVESFKKEIESLSKEDQEKVFAEFKKKNPELVKKAEEIMTLLKK
jgi:hypothetical protein